MPDLMVSNLAPYRGWSNDPLDWPCSFGGVEFQYVGPGDALVFYDWLRAADGDLAGVELHLLDDCASLNEFKKTLGVPTGSTIQRVWLREVREAEPMGLEAFGDISLGCWSRSYWLLALGMNNWLAPEDIQYLRKWSTT